ncbi:MAG: tRNA (adenosine(37)-N6)-threonylcarbamoyltransferase complex dimerization subunit type 1 TsaB [Candidatus Competibacterales bacterium]|nr:tRNA (adenosine(37)-N6)-threonylcarbamoyltransferase complex dimerization subunit type 1 TsaB [Candidatus Competibacterales bacterium]
MKLLALDTATEACSAAVLIGAEVVAHRFEQAPRRHAELILPQCEAVLTEAGLTPSDLDAVAFGRGPGSFTGLRIATSVVQGIAFAAGLPVLPVSTLAAMAHATARRHGIEQVAAALDARMEEVYWGGYRVSPDGDVTLLIPECVCPPDAVPAPPAGTWYGAGGGWARYGAILEARFPVAAVWSDCLPDAADIALLGRMAWQRGEALPAEQALPVYLRDRVTRVHD